MLRWLIDPAKVNIRDRRFKEKEANKDAKANKKNREKVSKAKTKNAEGNQAAKAKTGEKEEYSPEELIKKVTEIAQQRGRRGFDRKAYNEKMLELVEHAQKQGPGPQLYILSSMISSNFDNTGGAFDPMRMSLWTDALEKVNKMQPLLCQAWKLANPEEEGQTAEVFEDEDPRSVVRQQELFVSFVQKLDDELYKALQHTTDVYGPEYQNILGNSSKFLVTLVRAVNYLKETKQSVPLSAVALRLLEQLYYKYDTLNEHVYMAIQQTVPEEEQGLFVWPISKKTGNSCPYIAELCLLVQANTLPKTRVRAALCQAYHLALHDQFQHARDMVNLGSLYDSVIECDTHTQILYNRTMAQLGLCAFRLGEIREADLCLRDLCMHNKARELLAQGIAFARNMEKTPEQERDEKKRLYPYHMHINNEVLEGVHLISAMLLEVCTLSQKGFENNKGRIGRVLKRLLDQNDKMAYVGPPELAKEAVTAAAKSLQRGGWREACAVLEDLRMWDHISPKGPAGGKEVKEQIKEKIKTEGLKTFLTSYASIYDAFQLDQLVTMFDLPEKTVHSIVSRMMIKEEITAFWDESSKFVLMQHVEPTVLQRFALDLALRGAEAVESNERLVDQKLGGYGIKDKSQQTQQNANQPRWDDGGKGGKGKGKGNYSEKKGKGKGGKTQQKPAANRGWENARAGALRGGTGQVGWSSAKTTPMRTM